MQTPNAKFNLNLLSNFRDETGGHDLYHKNLLQAKEINFDFIYHKTNMPCSGHCY